MAGGLETLRRIMRPAGKAEIGTPSAIPEFGKDGRMGIVGDPMYIPGVSTGLPFGIALEREGTSIRFIGENGAKGAIAPDTGWRVFLTDDSRYQQVLTLPPEKQYEALKELTGNQWKYFVETLDNGQPQLSEPYWLIIKKIPDITSTDRMIVPDIARFRIDPGQRELRQVICSQCISLPLGRSVNLPLLTRDAPLVLTDRMHAAGNDNVIVLEADLLDAYTPTFGGSAVVSGRLPIMMMINRGVDGYTASVRRPAYPQTETDGRRRWETLSEADRRWIQHGADGLVVRSGNGSISFRRIGQDETETTLPVQNGDTIIACSSTGTGLERQLVSLTLGEDGWLKLISGPDRGSRSQQGTVVYSHITGKSENVPGKSGGQEQKMDRRKALDILQERLPDNASEEERRTYNARQAEALSVIFPGITGSGKSEAAVAHAERSAMTVNPLCVR